MKSMNAESARAPSEDQPCKAESEATKTVIILDDVGGKKYFNQPWV